MDILSVLRKCSINLTLDNLIVLIIILVILIIICKWIYVLIRKHKISKYEIVELNVNIGKFGSVKIVANKEVSLIAYQAWVEIITRKVGLLFEDNKDVITEIYDSWYQIFKVIRELLKSVESSKNDKDVQILIKILLEVLNNGLRPHLTKYQAEFRKWYENEKILGENKESSPQEIQRKYKKYNELIEDLKITNKKMINFSKELEKLI